MASPAPGRDNGEWPPPGGTASDEAPLDPSTIELRYRYHRSRRRDRVRVREENRLASYRFYIAMTVLLALAVAFLIGSWHEIQRLFGL